MKTFTTALVALAATCAHALPPAAPPQSVTLLFQAGPASYNLTLPADGRDHPTGQDALGVSLVVAPDYDPYRYCTFRTAGGRPASLAPSLVQRPGVDAWPVNQVAVGPPQPIVAVSCSGVCLGVYGDCYDTHGQYVAPCCNGFCAANKCRPWNQGSI